MRPQQDKWRSNRMAVAPSGSIRAAAGRGMPSQPLPAPTFFVSQKRGEVGELRSLLRSLPAEDPSQPQNRQRRREVLKRLIAYMTLGIDVSSLFPEVVLTSATSDVVQKKLISLYLNNYAPLNQELLVLAINAYQKDLRDVDSRIRGLALKGLTSLRAESTVEYAEEAVRAGLQDSSNYVRRAAMMGVLKLYCLDLGDEYRQRIKDKFGDAVRANCMASDPQLVVTALSVMNELDGGFAASRQVIVNFFNHSEKCDSLNRSVVLSLLADYTPRSTEEMLALLDTLESQLIIASPLIILGTVKVMLSLLRWHISRESDHNEDWTNHHLTTSAIKRAKSALLTLMASASAESGFVILSFIRQLIQMSPNFAQLFAEDWELMVVKHTDKSYNKALKFEILNALLNQNNWSHIKSAVLTFLSPPSHIQKPILKNAVNLLGNIALKFDIVVAEEVSSDLVSLYLMDLPSVSSAILPVMAVLLSKYQSLASAILPFLGTRLLPIDMLDFESLQALVWMSGEFREHTPYGNDLFIQLLHKAFKTRNAANYELEPMNAKESTAPVGTAAAEPGRYCEEQLIILKDVIAACCKILFVDPMGIKEVFTTILTTISSEILVCPPDLVERFLLTVRLLTHRPELLRKVYGQKALEEQKRIREETGKFSLYNRIGSVGLNDAFQDLDTVNGVLSTDHIFKFSLPFGGRYCEENGPAMASQRTNDGDDLIADVSSSDGADIELPTVATLKDAQESYYKRHETRFEADLLGDLDDDVREKGEEEEEEEEEENDLVCSSSASQDCEKLMD